MNDPICRECNAEPCACARGVPATDLEQAARAGQEANPKCQDGRGDPPKGCTWPLCGCDPTANEVLAALEDIGWPTPQERDALTARLAAAEADKSLLIQWAQVVMSLHEMSDNQLAELKRRAQSVIDAAIAQETKP